jgi:hypothetical protein
VCFKNNKDVLSYAKTNVSLRCEGVDKMTYNTVHTVSEKTFSNAGAALLTQPPALSPAKTILRVPHKSVACPH